MVKNMKSKKYSDKISKAVLSALCIALFICCLFFATRILQEEKSIKNLTQTDSQSQSSTFTESNYITEICTTITSVETSVNEIPAETSNSTQVFNYEESFTENFEPESIIETHNIITESIPIENNENISNTKTVYITQSGTKYHLETCSYLSKSKIEISRSDAINEGYEPCSRCKP